MKITSFLPTSRQSRRDSKCVEACFGSVNQIRQTSNWKNPAKNFPQPPLTYEQMAKNGRIENTLLKRQLGQLVQHFQVIFATWQSLDHLSNGRWCCLCWSWRPSNQSENGEQRNKTQHATRIIPSNNKSHISQHCFVRFTLFTNYLARSNNCSFKIADQKLSQLQADQKNTLQLYKNNNILKKKKE